MKIDNAKLTQFALNELDDPQAVEEISKAVQKSLDLQKQVEEIQKLEKSLRGAFDLEAEGGGPVRAKTIDSENHETEDSKPIASSKIRNNETPGLAAITKFGLFFGAIAACLVAIAVFMLPGLSKIDNGDVAQFRSESTNTVAVLPPPGNADTPKPEPIDTIVLEQKETAKLQRLEEPSMMKREETNSKNLGKPQSAPPIVEEQTFALSPFEVTDADASRGYVGTNSVSATRLREQVAELPAPEKVVTHDWNREGYDSIEETEFRSPTVDPLSTFSIDVDTASYANLRRFILNGSRPSAGAVRIEEMINYFQYNYPAPENDKTPFSINVDAATAPWNSDHEIVRIGLQGYKLNWEDRPASNLVFLIDVSGSMQDDNKLPLIKKSLRLLLEKLDGRDRVAIVTYAGADRIALPSTTANNFETILHAVDQLGAGGSTNGSSGIRTAYEIANKHFIKSGNNRILLLTDGDFNVGTTSRSELAELITEKAKSGVYLSVFGLGMGNYQDATLEELSNKGNGNFGYIDSIDEARRLLVEGAAGVLVTIAKDVKIQVEFNPTLVEAYRLIGYENRNLNAEDFNNDKKDAGEIGAGHSVTALYEIIPVGTSWKNEGKVDELKYQKPQSLKRDEAMKAGQRGEMLTVKVRYKQPDGEISSRLEVPFAPTSVPEFAEADADFRWATSVAAFGMILRESKYTEELTLADIKRMAREAKGQTDTDRRSEFIELIEKANQIPKN